MSGVHPRGLVCAALVVAALSLPASGCQAILGIKDPVLGAAADGAAGGDASVSPDGQAENQDGSAGNLDAQKVVYGTPMARGDLGMAYNAARKRVILFGGINNFGGGGLLDDTWAWDGTGWTEVTPAAGSPPRREDFGIAYAGLGKVVLLGGYDGSNALGDIWAWDGAGWTNVTPAQAAPMARISPAMAYDAARGKVVMFGGAFGPNYLDDTWTWDGNVWTDVTPASGSPPARADAMMAYDAAAGKVVLFGGYDGRVRGDTWAWDGTGWTNVTPATGNPAARSVSAMAYDAARGKVVLFGGQDANDSALADTWEWNGSSWTNVTPASGNPPARSRHAMAYDAARGRVILFGGDGSTGYNLGDTWAWDGTKWTKQ